MSPNSSAQGTQRNRPVGFVGALLITLIALVLLILLPIILPIVFLGVAVWAIIGLTLHLIAYTFWIRKAHRTVLVTSESPNWQKYIEDNIIPRLPSDTVILNYSRRREWSSFNLASALWGFHAGDEEYCPVAIVLRRFRPPKVIRFFSAFKDYKHGKSEALEKSKEELFQAIAS